MKYVVSAIILAQLLILFYYAFRVSFRTGLTLVAALLFPFCITFLNRFYPINAYLLLGFIMTGLLALVALFLYFWIKDNQAKKS